MSKLAAEDTSIRLTEEHTHIKVMLELADGITENAKGKALLTALKKGFAELKRLGANRKAIIFTENRETQKYLFGILGTAEYTGKVITYSGEQVRDYTVMERFEKDFDILITTDIAAEGLCLEFAEHITPEDAEIMAEYAPGRIIFTDQCFDNATDKSNVKLTLRDRGITIKML